MIFVLILGIDEFLEQIEGLKKDYFEIYKPEYDRIKKESLESREKDNVKTDVTETTKLTKETLIEFGDYVKDDYEENSSDDEEDKKKPEQEEQMELSEGKNCFYFSTFFLLFFTN